MKNRCTLGFIILFMQLFSAPSWAGTPGPVTGRIHRPHFTSTQIVLANGDKLRVESQNTSTRNNLLRLKEGDLLAGQGVANLQKTTLSLHSIELVGLNDLVGFWSTSGSNPVYLEFEDFQNLSIYGDDFFSANAKNKKSQWYKYMISPSIGNLWTMYIVQGSREFSGNLVLHRDQLRINIIEPRTGIVIHRLKLRRMRD